ncbi:MAG: glycosyltransferase family 2 protein [Deltaproteobacteria bacterium]|nr:glycosyltransferase family 2 protein [Deltaproteobacteria bacterium]
MTLLSKATTTASCTVSIVTPSLNHGAYIRAAIDSVLAQDYPMVEYTVLDGGSTDDTLDILRDYSGRIGWICEPDQGLYDAVNKGWHNAKGDYLGYLNADDVLYPGAISTLVGELNAHPESALAYGGSVRLSEQGIPVDHLRAGLTDYDRLIRHGNNIFTGAMLVRRSALKNIGFFDTAYKYAADYDFCIKVAKCYPLRFIDQFLAAFRVHQNSKSQNSRWKMWHETLTISYKHSHKIYAGLYTRYIIDRLIHSLPESFLWDEKLIPLRKKLRRLWGLGG